MYRKAGEQELARWASNNLSILKGGYKYDVVGVEAASRVLFGKSASKLSQAQQYMFAAAIRSPLKFDRKNKYRISDNRMRRMIFGKRQKGESEKHYLNRRDGRAMRCMNNSKITLPENRVAIESELLKLYDEGLTPYLHSELEAPIKDIGIAYKSMAVHMERHDSGLLMGGSRVSLKKQLLSLLEILAVTNVAEKCLCQPRNPFLLRQIKLQRNELYNRGKREFFVYLLKEGTLAEIYFRYVAKQSFVPT